MERNSLLRQIPKVDDLLRRDAIASLPLPTIRVTELVRKRLDALRGEIMAGETDEIPSEETLCSDVCAMAHEASKPSLRPLINATGIVLHTNLGRACLSEHAAQAASDAARRYSTLEYDLESGERGSRHAHVEGLLCRLTGAEAAMVVNNNAAAVLLVLSAIAKGGEVIVSRGELVEIGGSFRVPEIIEQCGCRLREVGTTNRTYLRDYQAAANADTNALLKVHTSNYRIMGFTESPPLNELVALAGRMALPIVEDLGSGCLIDLEPYGIRGEPTVMESVRAGVDVITFSGDKLLGGPQAGLILGKRAYVEQFKRHPLARAVRVDKMTLAALEATLTCYLDPLLAIREIPTLRMLAEPAQALRGRAERLRHALVNAGIPCETVSEQDPIGGGCVPVQLLPTYSVAICPAAIRVDTLEQRLRHADVPVVGRIAKGRYLLDVRTISEEEIPVIVRGVSEALR